MPSLADSHTAQFTVEPGGSKAVGVKKIFSRVWLGEGVYTDGQRVTSYRLEAGTDCMPGTLPRCKSWEFLNSSLNSMHVRLVCDRLRACCACLLARPEWLSVLTILCVPVAAGSARRDSKSMERVGGKSRKRHRCDHRSPSYRGVRQAHGRPMWRAGGDGSLHTALFRPQPAGNNQDDGQRSHLWE